MCAAFKAACVGVQWSIGALLCQISNMIPLNLHVSEDGAVLTPIKKKLSSTLFTYRHVEGVLLRMAAQCSQQSV